MTDFLSILPSQPSWEILDASKLTTYMSCPRKYFYEYLLGWRPDYPNNHLVFGTAWHLGVEHLLKSEHSSENIELAQYLFLEYYRRYFPKETDELFPPKTPQNALASLEDYARYYKSDKHKYEVLHTEVGGLCLIGSDMPMHFRMDAALRISATGQIINLDHKTSQRRYSNWTDHYQLDTKTLLYLHALYCLYGTEVENVKGALVRTAFFYKAQPTNFEEAPIEKSLHQMQDWLTSTSYWYERLQDDHELLMKNEDSEDSTMAAFAKNPNSCFNYGRTCDYFNFCDAWSNPLSRCEQIPLGFKQEFWDPRNDEAIKERVDLTNLPILQ